VLGPSALADEFACTPAELFRALLGPDREIENITHDTKRPSLWIDFSEDNKVRSDELMVNRAGFTGDSDS
jgi:hypothetical protein